MDPLVITTQVDLSGAQALQAGVVAAMTRIIAAQQAVNEQAKNLRQTYLQLGAAAAQGSSEAAAVIAQEMALLAEKKIALEQARDAYRELSGAVDQEAESHARNAAAIDIETSAQRGGISERQAASASLRILEGGIQGSTRAAGALLVETLGLGPVLRAAFPIIGAIALVEILARIPALLAEIKDWWAGVTDESRKAVQEQSRYYDAELSFLAETQLRKAHIPESGLSGTDRAKQEIADYENEIATINRLTDALTHASAARNFLAGKTPDRAAVLAEITGLQDALKAQGVEIAAPNINVDASDKEFRKEADEFLDRVEQFRFRLQRDAESIQEVKIPELKLSLSKDTAAESDRVARDLAQANREAAREAEQAWQTAYKGSVAAIEESERTSIELTVAGSKARVAAIDAALREQQTLGLEKGDVAAEQGKEAADTEYYKSLLNQRLEALRAEKAAETAETLKAADDSTKVQQRQIQDAARSAEAQAAVLAAARKAAVPAFESPEGKADREISAAKDAADAQQTIDQQVLTSKVAAALKEEELYELLYHTGAINAKEYGEKVIEVNAQISEAAADAAAKTQQAWAKETEQEIALREQAAQQEVAAIHNFVTQAQSSLNSFLVTVLTTTGVAGGRISEWRYLGEQWQRLVFQMEKDFLSAILKMIEDTALFNSIKDKLQGVLSGIFSKIGLGPQNVTAGISLPAAGPLSPSTIQTITGGASGQTAAEVQATAALNAFTAALTHATTVTATATGAKSSETAATTASTGAKTANTAATSVGTGAQAAHTSSTVVNTGAQTAHTASVTVGTGAQAAHTAVTAVNTGAQAANAVTTTTDTVATAAHSTTIFSNIAAWIAHEAAVIADTAALIVHKIVALFTGGAATGGLVVTAQTGGLISGPGTETSDDIPMRVSAGEYIVKGAAVRQPGILPLLHAINSGRLSGGQLTPQYGGAGAPELASPFDEGGSGGAGGGSQFTDASSNFALHYHAGNVSTLDSSGVDQVLERGQKGLTKLVQQAVRRGTINPRDLLKR